MNQNPPDDTTTPRSVDQQQACSACAALDAIIAEAHAILDADESKIIRNAKDGYPEGREPRELTLAERVKALCIYAADWKRWCEESEKQNAIGDGSPSQDSNEGTK
jgi:hypothetical protein